MTVSQAVLLHMALLVSADMKSKEQLKYCIVYLADVEAQAVSTEHSSRQSLPKGSMITATWPLAACPGKIGTWCLDRVSRVPAW